MTNAAGADVERRPSWLPGRQTLVALGWLAASVLPLLFWYRDAAERAVRQWIDIPTYSYAFLIAPLAVYLVADKAGRVSIPPPEPWPLPLALHLPIGLAWYLAVAVEVVELQQFCLLAAVYVTFAALFGLRMVKAHVVALVLLGFMVPTGQFLVPPLQVMSAHASVLLLRLAGAPVFLDGFNILMPEAAYHVEPGCAGLNFVLVTIVLGLVMGELFFRTLFKKVAVMVGLLVAAIVSNPIRIFGIVYIDWQTNRTTDIVSDHLTYGWAFFAAVLAVVLPIALRYRDDAADRPPDSVAAKPAGPGIERKLATTAIGGMALAAMLPLAVLAIGHRTATAAGAMAPLPAVNGVAPESQTGWRVVAGSIAEIAATYAGHDRPPMRAEAALRLAPTPRARLVERWPLLEDRRFVEVARTEFGRVGLYRSGTIADRTLWAMCYPVAGTCQPDPGGLRRAIVATLPRDPLARAGYIVLSQPVPPGAAMPRGEQYRPLLAALGQIVAATAPNLAGSGP